MQPGYDHSYYFISTFMEDHLRWHAERLGIGENEMTFSRRSFLQAAAAMGASLAWAGPARASRDAMARAARPLSRKAWLPATRRPTA